MKTYSKTHSSPRCVSRGLRIAALLLAFAASAPGAVAQDLRAPKEGGGVASNVVPDELKGVGIDEKFGEKIPLELRFTDETGERVALKDYFDGERPVVITLNYSDCPMLCSTQLNALVKGLKELEWMPGKEFELLTVSIDPRETPKKATLAKRKYFRGYARPEAEAGWHFLTVDERLEGGEDPATGEPYEPGESQIRKLADALGFRYVFHADSQEYLHTAAIFVLSPDATISRYLYGISYPAPLLKTALVEAGEGKVGTLVDRLILYCFLDYDSDSGSYAATAFKVMRFGALGFVVLFGGFLMLLWFGGRKKRNATQLAADTNTNPVQA
jgi:protein SCO1/2